MFILTHLDIILAELLVGGILWCVGKGIYENFQDFRAKMKSKDTI